MDTECRCGSSPCSEARGRCIQRLVLHESVLVSMFMECLRSLGVTLSLDDFRAGQSTVASLLALPVQEVTFDRSLLANGTNDPVSWEVLGALLALATSVALSMVMDGVEPLLWQVLYTVAQGDPTGHRDSPAEVAQLLAVGSATQPVN